MAARSITNGCSSGSRLQRQDAAAVRTNLAVVAAERVNRVVVAGGKNRVVSACRVPAPGKAVDREAAVAAVASQAADRLDLCNGWARRRQVERVGEPLAWSRPRRRVSISSPSASRISPLALRSRDNALAYGSPVFCMTMAALAFQ